MQVVFWALPVGSINAPSCLGYPAQKQAILPSESMLEFMLHLCNQLYLSKSIRVKLTYLSASI